MSGAWFQGWGYMRFWESSKDSYGNRHREGWDGVKGESDENLTHGRLSDIRPGSFVRNYLDQIQR